MNIYRWPLLDKYRTVQEVKYAVGHYSGDLYNFPELMGMDLRQYFNYVRKIPYARDIKGEEVVSRPNYLLSIFPALDCKKKSILMGSFMKEKYGPGSYRYVLSSDRPDGKIGHIFTQYFDGNEWKNADATYPFNRLNGKKIVTNFEIIRG